VKFRPFAEARDYVRSLILKNAREWEEYCRTGNKPLDIPSSPNTKYKSEWKGYGDWLGTGTARRKRTAQISYRPFDKAREYVRTLGLKGETDWKEFCKLGKRPQDVPSNPDIIYREEWKGWGDWLGTGPVLAYSKTCLPYEESKKYVRSIRFKNRREYWKWCKSGKKPGNIPTHPERVYKKEWKGIADWLGIEPWPFLQAIEYVHSLGFKDRKEYQKWSKSGKRPKNVPSNPNDIYKTEWKSWGDWLGIEPWPFLQAREYVHSLGLRSQREWEKYCKSGKKTDYVLTHPDRVYKKEWKGWGDWLGTDVIAPQNKEFLPFEEAKKFVHSLGLKNAYEWEKWRKSENRPKDIPTSPEVVYKNEWKGLPDWLGYEDSDWSVRRVKELLRGLIESKIIYQWDEAVLYSFLLRKGLLNLQSRHAQFFKNLIEASRTQEGLKAIEDYANSNSDIPPDLSTFKETGQSQQEEEIESAFPQELSNLIEDADPLDYGEIKTAEQILAQTNAYYNEGMFCPCCDMQLRLISSSRE
jgi:Phage-integrase repeat unit